jgi:hypothetical protein
VKFRFYQVFSGVHVYTNPTKNLIEPKLFMNRTKSLIEAKLYMNLTKSLIEAKLCMNPTKNLIDPKRFYQVFSGVHVVYVLSGF